MTAILTTSYFIYDPVRVPNIVGSGDPHVSIQNGILALAELYEVAFLRKILGTAFADEFYTHKAEVSGIWYNLKVKIYVVSGSIYTSPVANYVYNHWLGDQQSQTTGIGSVKPKPEEQKNLITNTLQDQNHTEVRGVKLIIMTAKAALIKELLSLSSISLFTRNGTSLTLALSHN